MRRELVALAFLLPCGASSAEDIVTLSTRGGVTQPYLLTAPENGRTDAVAMLFPGGRGKVDLERESARAVLDRGNFLVRARRLFAAGGIATAIMDAPSDRPAGMDDRFRLEEAHTQDIAGVVADLRRRFPGVAVFLVGTSRGTLSAAAAARRLGAAIDGVALTATLFLATRQQPGLSRFDLAAIAAPLLFVHHADDGCAVTPYAEAKRLSDRYPLVTVRGGAPSRSGPCEALSEHGFFGREAAVVEALAHWMLKRPYHREIQ